MTRRSPAHVGAAPQGFRPSNATIDRRNDGYGRQGPQCACHGRSRLPQVRQQGAPALNDRERERERERERPPLSRHRSANLYSSLGTPMFESDASKYWNSRRKPEARRRLLLVAAAGAVALALFITFLFARGRSASSAQDAAAVREIVTVDVCKSGCKASPSCGQTCAVVDPTVPSHRADLK